MIPLLKQRNLFFNCHPVTWLTSLTFVIFLAAGCAIDDIGLVKVRHYENGTMHMVSKEAWGAYLSTDEADGGLMFGYMNRLLFYPKTTNSTSMQPDKLFLKLHQDQFLETRGDKLVMLSQAPVAWVTDNRGLIFNANPLRIGITVGQESREAVRLPDDFDGIFVFKYDSSGKTQAFFGRDDSWADAKPN